VSHPRPRRDPLPIEAITEPLDAVVEVPGSKSITNRALLCAALAEGRSRLTGVLFADDTEAMMACIRSLGATISVDREACTVDVVGTAGRVSAEQTSLDAGQSGTTARFIAAALILSDEEHLLDAEPQMRARPMGPTFDALRSLGASVVEVERTGFLPVRVRGAAHSTRPTVQLPGDLSSQFVSGLLLVAPCLAHGLRLELSTRAISAPYLAMTVATMRRFGALVDQPSDGVFVVEPGGYRGLIHHIEPDASAASYFFAAAAICGGRVRIDGLGSSSIQGDVHFVDVLSAMGAQVDVQPESITVTGGDLHGVDADFADISDTAQTIAAVAAFADGPTRISGIGFIRAKETDRLAAVVTELGRCGIGAVELEDGFEVHPAPIRPAVIHTYDDHRMAMSFSLIGLRSDGIEIADPACVAKTFPTFFDVLDSIRPEQT
jgi:3-phosphoshikimate 1-carboxyvinyltransferase